MSNPTQSDVHVDAVLSNISVAYMNDKADFVADKVFPTVPSGKQSDKWFVFDKGDLLRRDSRKRGDCVESAGSGYRLSTSSFFCEPYSLHMDVGDQQAANADAALRPYQDAAIAVTEDLLIGREADWVSAFFTTSVWDNDQTPSNLWDNYATSDPITDLEDYKDTIRTSTARKANKLVLGAKAYRYLRHHPLVVDRFKYTSAESISASMIAKLFDLDEVLVAYGVRNSALEEETDSLGYIATQTSGLLVHTAPNPGLMTPSAGYTFTWNGYTGSSGLDVTIKRFRMEAKECDRIEGKMAYDMVATGTDLGVFINGATS